MYVSYHCLYRYHNHLSKPNFYAIVIHERTPILRYIKGKICRPSLVRSLVRRGIPPSLPPFHDTSINFVSRRTIPNQAKPNSQFGLYIPIPRLVVEKKHILILDPTRALDAREMLRLARGEDLDVLKVIESAYGLVIGRSRVIGKRWNDMESFQHVARKFWGMGA